MDYDAIKDGMAEALGGTNAETAIREGVENSFPYVEITRQAISNGVYNAMPTSGDILAAIRSAVKESMPTKQEILEALSR